MNNRTIKKLFFNSLKRGTGEAVLLLKAYPNIDFSDYLIKGATINYAYDGQAESSRATYIFELIELTKQQDKIRQAVVQGLHKEKEETWNLTHLFDLAKQYVLAGDLAMKKEIYKRFLSPPIPHSDWVGISEILALDGWEGLLFIINKLGKDLLSDPDAWQSDSLLESFQEKKPELNVLGKLEKKAQQNIYVKAYLEAVNQRNIIWKRNKPKLPVYDNILDEIRNTRLLSFKRIKELTVKEIELLAKQLLQTKRKSQIQKLLWIFREHPFPLDIDFVLDLAQSNINYNYRIHEFAIDALQYFQSDKIRAFVLQKLQKTTIPSPFTNLLIKNYKDGDEILLSRIATKFKSEHIIENLASSYIEIYKNNLTPKCQVPLEILYNKMNCGLHRNELLKVLIHNKALNPTIEKEIKFDSYKPTRKLRMSKINL